MSAKLMLSRSAITKLKAILIIDLIIVISAIGAYFYIEPSLPKPASAEFVLSDLTISPPEAEIGQSITISVNITNIGTVAGEYLVELKIWEVLTQNKTVYLLSGESIIADFIIEGKTHGTYIAKIGELSQQFIVKPPPAPSGNGGTPAENGTSARPANIGIYSLKFNPTEGWPDVPMSITAEARNIGDVAGSIDVNLYIDGTLVETKQTTVPAGVPVLVKFTWTPQTTGTYSAMMTMPGYTLSGIFKVVPYGTNTLTVNTSPSRSGVEFTINGQTQVTPYSVALPRGTYEVAMPLTSGSFKFERWTDGGRNNVRTVSLSGPTTLTAVYAGTGSCPSLYVWNGTNYVYRAEVSDGTGYLGILDYFSADGSLVFAYSDPWDYIKLTEIQTRTYAGTSYYDMIFTQNWNEIFYLDSARLLVIDHPANVDVFSTKGTYIYTLRDLGTIYTVSKNPSKPVSAFYIGVNGEREDVLSQISERDGIYTVGNEFQWDTLELNLGDLSDAQEIKLILSGTILYSSGEEQGKWAAQFFNKPGEKPFSPPYMEVKNEYGEWVRVPDDRQFPLLRVYSESFVVNLTGLFPTNDYSLRIHTFFDTRFDYIAVDTTPQQEIRIQEVYPAYAELQQEFETTSRSTGNFTRYGNVTQLMLEADNKFVIGRQGDQVSLLFPADLGPVPENMERSYFIFVSCWFKVDGLPYLPFTVDPMPFHNMSVFPYSSSESYPYGTHQSYLLEYNTRTITAPQGP